MTNPSGDILMDGKNSIAAIVTALEKKFPDVDLKGDVHDFVNSAIDEGWINV